MLFLSWNLLFMVIDICKNIKKKKKKPEMALPKFPSLGFMA
jgi:hypothetical protein